MHIFYEFNGGEMGNMDQEHYHVIVGTNDQCFWLMIQNIYHFTHNKRDFSKNRKRSFLEFYYKIKKYILIKYDNYGGEIWNFVQLLVAYKLKLINAHFNNTLNNKRWMNWKNKYMKKILKNDIRN